MRKSTFILFIIVTALSLQSCVNVALSGAQATYNRYNISNSLRDQYINMQADRKVHWYTQEYKDSNVSVSTFNCVVVITGEVPSKALRDKLTEMIKTIPDVVKVYNLTTISNTLSTLTMISDGWITTKIKSQLLAAIDVDPSQIKVITENGIVYLIGTVFPDQANIAAEIARNTEGVQGVVKIFSYLKITSKPNA